MKKKEHFNNEKQRWSLRKLSVGLSSVMLGLTFISGANLVQADTTTSANQAEVATESQSSSNTTDESKVSSESSTTSQETTSNNAASSASNTTAAAETASSTKAETTQSSETSESATENKTQDSSAAVSSTSSSSASASSDTAQTTSTQNSSTQANQSSENQQSSASSTTLKVSVSSLKTNSKLAANTLSTSLAANSTKQTRQWTHYTNGWSYKDDKGDVVYNQLKKISGKWYYFDNQGYAKTGWYTSDNGSKYYFDKTNANALTGWQTIDSNKYYFDKDNAQMYTGWHNIDDVYYSGNQYFAESGIWNDLSKVTVNSWYKDTDGKYLYKKSDDYYNDDTYYNEDFANDEVLEINGVKYLFDSDYHLVTNSVGYVYNHDEETSTQYYTNQDGIVQVNKWDKYSDNGKEYWVYSKADGTLATNEILEINGTKYLFDSSKLVTNGIGYISSDDETSTKYYANQDGIVQVSKWNKLSVDGKEYWVYSQADGTLARDGYFEINGNKYLFDSDGYLTTNSIYDGYYTNQDGILQVNKWNKYSDNGKEYWIYSKADGTLAQNEVLTVNGVKYFFDSNYHMLENVKGKSPSWQKDSQGWSFKDNNGNSLYNQLKKIDDSWYYFDEQGYAKTGWKRVNGSWYYFDPASNQARTGLQKIDNQWYYFNPTTAEAVTGRNLIDGKLYNFDTENAWAHTGWNDDQTSYFDPTTAEAVTGWKRIDGQWYYFDPDNEKKVTGLQEINGKKQYFTSTGVWNELDNVANSSWYKATDGTWLYKKSDGTFAKNEVLSLNGVKYLFDSDNHLVTNNSYQTDTNGNGYSYYANQDGIIVTNKWAKVTDSNDNQQYWVYANADGTLASDGVVNISGTNYLFDWRGYLVTNDTLNGYYANKDGIVVTNKWIKTTAYSDENDEQKNQYWIYAGADGSLASDSVVTINGVNYLFNDSRHLVTNDYYKLDDGYGTYYANQDGIVQVNKWDKYLDDGTVQWLYSKSDGTLAENEKLTIDGVAYIFGSNYQMVTNSKYSADYLEYYLDANGLIAINKWNKDTDGSWIYSKADGTLAKSETLTIGNVKYTFDNTGHLIEASTTVKPSWKQTAKGWTYSDEHGNLVTKKWEKIGNNWYHFDEQGIANTGWQEIDGSWYYFNLNNANAVTGWQKINGSWYYFDPSSNVALEGLQELNNKLYYFDSASAKALTGWQEFKGSWYKGSWYYFDPANAYALTGWKKLGNQWYYFNQLDGKMLTGWQKIDGKQQYFNQSGVWQPNAIPSSTTGTWKKDSDKNWTFTKSNGQLAKEEILTIDGKRYAFDYHGHLVTNDYYDGYYADQNGEIGFSRWNKDLNGNYTYSQADGSFVYDNIVTINGHKYAFAENGFMIANGKYGNYYFGADGAAKTNSWILLKDDDSNQNWLYAKADGTLAEQEVLTINGKKYYFDRDNYLATNTKVSDHGNAYYVTTNGQVATNQWISYTTNDDETHWMYAKADGTLANDEVVSIDGKKYFFDSDNEMRNTTDSNGIYVFNKDGSIVTNRWVSFSDDDNAVKYVKADGTYAKNEVLTIDGSKYIFDNDGHLITSTTVTVGSNLYYVNADGVVQDTPNKWISYTDDDDEENQHKLYNKADGTLAEGEVVTIDGNDYLFDASGYLVTDRSYTIGNVEYYTNSEGIVISKNNIDDEDE